MPEFKILVVDDESSQRMLMRTFLEARNYQVFEADDGLTALEELKRRKFDLVLLDMRMKEMDGLETLRQMGLLRIETPVIIITAFGTVKSAVDAMKLGAFDYLSKPIDLEELSLIVEKIQRQLPSPATLSSKVFQKYRQLGIISRSPKFEQVLEMVNRASMSDATILLTGESGTGKSLIAKAIHHFSPRSKGPFIKVNCGALTETLLESELFGIEPNVATGVSARKGKFELAHRGTIFLDEIGDMSLNLQVKVLHVLQDKEFMKVGGSRLEPVNIRVISATNQNLEELISQGKFREDLFYRLNVISIHVPNLQERKEDIPLLVDIFIERFAEKNDKSVTGVSKQVMNAFKNYDWPGNVRELENSIEHGVIMARSDKVIVKDLPRALRYNIDEEALDTDKPVPSIKEMERQLIVKALKETGSNRTEAAKLLGIGRRTLQYKMKEYQIKESEI